MPEISGKMDGKWSIFKEGRRFWDLQFHGEFTMPASSKGSLLIYNGNNTFFHEVIYYLNISVGDKA